MELSKAYEDFQKARERYISTTWDERAVIKNLKIFYGEELPIDETIIYEAPFLAITKAKELMEKQKIGKMKDLFDFELPYYWKKINDKLEEKLGVDTVKQYWRQYARTTGWIEEFSKLVSSDFDSGYAWENYLSSLTKMEIWGNFFQKEGYLDDLEDREKALLKLGGAASCWFVVGGILIIAKRPKMISVNILGSLHSEEGPALQLEDGTNFWFWNGTEVKKEVIEDPYLFIKAKTREKLTPTDRIVLALMEKSPAELLKKLAVDEDEQVASWAVENKNMPIEAIEELSKKGLLKPRTERRYRRRLSEEIIL